MPLRFRKTIKIFPGLWLNISKRNISLSFGTNKTDIIKPTINLNAKKKDTITLGIPGSGLSYKENIED